MEKFKRMKPSKSKIITIVFQMTTFTGGSFVVLPQFFKQK